MLAYDCSVARQTVWYWSSAQLCLSEIQWLLLSKPSGAVPCRTVQSCDCAVWSEGSELSQQEKATQGNSDKKYLKETLSIYLPETVSTALAQVNLSPETSQLKEWHHHLAAASVIIMSAYANQRRILNIISGSLHTLQLVMVSSGNNNQLFSLSPCTVLSCVWLCGKRCISYCNIALLLQWVNRKQRWSWVAELQWMFLCPDYYCSCWDWAHSLRLPSSGALCHYTNYD